MFSWIPPIAWADAGTLSVKTIVYRIDYYILNPLIQLGFIVALLIFIWGIVQFIMNRNQGSTSPFSKKKGSTESGEHILWGLVGLLIMVSAFGIMSLIKNLIGSDVPIPH